MEHDSQRAEVAEDKGVDQKETLPSGSGRNHNQFR